MNSIHLFFKTDIFMEGISAKTNTSKATVWKYFKHII